MNGSERKRLRTGWVVTAAGFGINVLVGISYTWSLFSQALVHQYGWLHSTAAAPYSMYLFTYALSMIPAGHLQDRFGPRGVVLLGATLASAGFVLSGILMTTPAVVVLWGTLVGSGMACCFAAVTPAAMSWFPDARRGLVSGIVVTGVGVSAWALAPVVTELLARSVSAALVGCGLFILVGVGTLSRLMRAATPLTIKVTTHHTLRSLFGSALFRRLWLAFFCTTAAGVTVVSHVAELTRVHAGSARPYIAVGVFAMCNAAGRLIGGLLSDRLGRIRSIQVVFLGILAALIFMTLSPNELLMNGAVALLGLCYGGIFGVFPAATVALFGPSDFGFKYGVVFSAIAVSGIIPSLAGVVFERYGSFHPTLMLLMALCVAGLGLTTGLERGHPVP